MVRGMGPRAGAGEGWRGTEEARASLGSGMEIRDWTFLGAS
jgi:hypothetical protein